MNNMVNDESMSSLLSEIISELRAINEVIRDGLDDLVSMRTERRVNTDTNVHYANRSVAKAYSALAAVGANYSAIARVAEVHRNTLMNSTAEEWVQFRKAFNHVKSQKR